MFLENSRLLPSHETENRNELTGLELTLKNLKKPASPFKTFVNEDVPMLENIAGFYKKSDGKTKKKILGCIFSKKLVLKKEELQPTPDSNRGHKTNTGFTQCQQGFQKSGHKKRGRL